MKFDPGEIWPLWNMTPNSPKKSTCLFGRWKMRTNSSPWSNHSYIGMILGWNVIRFKRAISTLTHWSLPFGSLCSFHFGIWNFILSTFKKYPLSKISQFSKMSTSQKYPLSKNVHFSKKLWNLLFSFWQFLWRLVFYRLVWFRQRLVQIRHFQLVLLSDKDKSLKHLHLCSRKSSRELLSNPK